MKYQVTLFSTTGKYRPVSALVDCAEYDKKLIQKSGIEKICISRLWRVFDLKAYGYTKVKIREYDPEKIASENKARYNAIKEAKYASGEWKRPKKEC